IDNVLENGTLNLALQADAVHLKHFTATNVQARVTFDNNDINVHKVALNHADGKLTMDAKVHQVNEHYNNASANINLENINIEKLLYAFDNFGLQSLNS